MDTSPEARSPSLPSEQQAPTLTLTSPLGVMSCWKSLPPWDEEGPRTLPSGRDGERSWHFPGHAMPAAVMGTSCWGSLGSCYLCRAEGSPDSWRCSSQTSCVSGAYPCPYYSAHQCCSGTAPSLPAPALLLSNSPRHGGSRAQGHTQHPGSSGDGGGEATRGFVKAPAWPCHV